MRRTGKSSSRLPARGRNAAPETEDLTRLAPHDHRRLGAELDLFVIDPTVGSGLPLWLPKGTVLRRALETFVTEEEQAAGYQHVATPHLGREELYETSGHLAYYRDSMFPTMVVDGERFTLKPMNCPHHIRIYQSRPRSYRDLPIRLAEFGTVYRYEKSGQLQGLTRVRGMTMNDAHIFCTHDQLEAEVRGVLDLTSRIYRTLGLGDFHVDLALHDPQKRTKYANRPELWERSEKALRSALVSAKVRFREVAGDAAFYGPKADIQMDAAAGHTFSVSTIQLDMLLPERFGVRFTNAAGVPEQPILIHRAPIGTLERFVAFLIEHFQGAFPLWLAPVHVRVLPVSRETHGYAQTVAQHLRGARLQIEVDESDETLQKKIRTSEVQKIPLMAVVGKKEAAAKTATLRVRGGHSLGTFSLDEARELLATQVTRRSLTLPTAPA